MEALTQAVDSGKVRYIGFSEWPLEKIEAALALKNVARFVSSQPQYSLLHREPERRAAAAVRARRHLAGGVVAARPGCPERQIPARCPGAGGQPRCGSLHGSVSESRTGSRRRCSPPCRP